MDSNNNFFYNYFIQHINYFYNYNKLKPSQPFKKYIENYKNSHKFKKLPLIYTNPRWDSINKKLLWNSFDQELAKRRLMYNNIILYQNSYLTINKLKYYYYFKFPISYNKKTIPTVILGNPKWNSNTKKLEWNIIYRK
jgi:hypothetical protein